MAPTLEEIDDVEDIDNMDFDPTDFDPRNPFSKDTPVTGGPRIKPVESTPPAAAASSSSQKQKQKQQQPPRMPSSQDMPQTGPTITSESDMEQFKHWQVVYPLYFDMEKSHAQGRRVPKQLAVKNPLAQTLMEACREIGIHCIYEAQKIHPKDWANPGRVRVQIRPEGEGMMATGVKVNNKRHLYRLLAEYLKAHPTTDQMPYNSSLIHHMKAGGMEPPENPVPLAVPKGWQINGILPLYSRAVSGGDQNDEMVKQMQQNMFPGMNSVPDKPKKIKIRQR